MYDTLDMRMLMGPFTYQRKIPVKDFVDACAEPDEKVRAEKLCQVLSFTIGHALHFGLREGANYERQHPLLTEGQVKT